MGNTLKKKLEACSCKSSCQIEQEVKEIKRFFRQLSFEDLIKLKEYIEKENDNKAKMKMETLC